MNTKATAGKVMCFVPGCRALTERGKYACDDHARLFAPAAKAYREYLLAMRACVEKMRKAA